uniref:Uncharacterized protein n=1 Tax=Phlebotomus papatasi TaxID=29031 RepID=A0A1B0DCG3_PHLPP
METSRKYQVSPYDPNFSSAARYTPPYTTAASTASGYSNIIFVTQTPETPDSGNLLGVIGNEQRLIDPAQTYILSSTNTRVLNTYVRSYNGYDASGCLVDQNDGMMVVNNEAERIELLVNNELSEFGYKNQNTNMMVNQSGSNYSMVEQPGILHQQQNHVENEHPQERLFLHSSMSPLYKDAI